MARGKVIPFPIQIQTPRTAEQRFIDYILRQGCHGATTDEVEIEEGLPAGTACACATLLLKAGMTIARGRRPTSNGGRGQVFYAAGSVWGTAPIPVLPKSTVGLDSTNNRNEEGDYPGDTYSKKCARPHVFRGLGLDSNSKVLVIAGHEAGDVRVLEGLGVLASNIVAVDNNPASIKSSRKRSPHARYITSDLSKALNVLKAEGETFDCIFIDLCGHFKTNLPLLMECACLLKPDGWLGLGASYGRDRIRPPSDESAARARYDLVVDCIRQTWKGTGFTFIPRLVTPWISYVGGCVEVERAEDGKLRKAKLQGGTPMLYIIGQVKQGSEGLAEHPNSTRHGLCIPWGEAYTTAQKDFCSLVRKVGVRKARDQFCLSDHECAEWLNPKLNHLWHFHIWMGHLTHFDRYDKIPEDVSYSQMILDILAKKGGAGATYVDIVAILGGAPKQTIHPRLSDLRKKNVIIRHGSRLTDQGKRTDVFYLPQFCKDSSQARTIEDLIFPESDE